METERIVAELQSGLAPVTHTPVHVRLDTAKDTIRITGVVTEADFADWLADAFDRLSTFLAEVDVPPAGPAGALFRGAGGRRDRGGRSVHSDRRTLHAPASARDVSIGEIPAKHVAVLVHAGDYDSIGDTYRTLGASVAAQRRHTGQHVHEWYVVGPTEADDPKSYRTEIAWPIAGA